MHSLDLLHREKGLGKKLRSTYDGLFKISQKLGLATYRLHMPASYSLHPVLNIAHLKPYQWLSPELGPQLSKPLGHSDFKALPEFEVEHVLQEWRRKAKNGRQVPEFLTRFVRYDATYDKWLTCKQLKNTLDDLQDWESSQRRSNCN